MARSILSGSRYFSENSTTNEEKMIFQNREDAGRKLGKALQEYQKRKEVIVLGLARGGMVVAAVIAKMLGVPFDVIITQKIGAPTNPELAIGAITENGKGYFNQRLI